LCDEGGAEIEKELPQVLAEVFLLEELLTESN